MKELNRKTPVVFYVGILLLAAVLITFHMSGGLYAKYRATADASDSARVAAYVFELVNEDQSIEIPVTYNADGSGIYTVQVKNTNGVKTCEVSQSYAITVTKLTDNIGLTLALYSDAECTVAVDGTGTLPAGTAETDTFYLKISLPANPEYTVASEIDLIHISVSSAQID